MEMLGCIMGSNGNIGEIIKTLRLSKKMTLKELSESTDLSIGFLSQVERGLTALAITSLEKIADALNVDLSYFFPIKKKNHEAVMRSYEKEVFQIQNNRFITYHLTNDVGGKKMLPRLIEILPSKENEEIVQYQHEGEEFVYVLEGVFALILNNEKQDLYPGDSVHFDSRIIHNWANYTNKTVRILSVNYPNSFKFIESQTKE